MSGFQINHIAIVVSDLSSALGFWRDALGLPVGRLEQNDTEQVKIAFLPVGGAEIELISPTSGETGVGRYLAKTGGGLHHLCLEVPDIDAALKSLADAHVELINAAPNIRDDGTRYAFVHPRSTGGVLLELYQLPVPKAEA